MARLPDVYDVRPTPRAGGSIATYNGGQVAAAVGQAGEVMGKMADDWQREQDTMAVFEARRKLDEWERGAIFDPQKGAANKLGKDSFGIGEVLTKDFDEASGKIAEGLTNQRQRMAYMEMAQSRRSQVMDWSTRHESKQRETYEAGQYEADIQAMADRAALFPDKAAGELSMQAQRTIGFLRGKGRSEEEIQAKIKADASRTHLGVIGSMVNAGKADQAKGYFDANKLAMSAEASLRAEASLKEVNARIKAQGAADDVLARGLSLRDALADVRGKFQGDEEAAVVQEVKARFAEREAGLAQAQKQATDDAWKIIANGGSRKSIPPALWNSLHGEEQRQINDYLEQKWRRAKADAEAASGEKQETNWGTFMALTDLARDNPERFLDPQTLLKAEPYLSKSQMGQLVTLRTGIQKGDAKATNLLNQVREAEKSIIADLKAAGIDTTPKDGDKNGAERLAAFRAALQSQIRAEQDASTTPLSPQRLQTIGLMLVREGIEQDRPWWKPGSGAKRGFEMEAGKSYIAKRFDDIPLSERSALADELVTRGMAKRTVGGGYILTDAHKAEIERAYTRGLEQGRFR